MSALPWCIESLFFTGFLHWITIKSNTALNSQLWTYTSNSVIISSSFSISFNFSKPLYLILLLHGTCVCVCVHPSSHVISNIFQWKNEMNYFFFKKSFSSRPKTCVNNVSRTGMDSQNQSVQPCLTSIHSKKSPEVQSI